MSGPPMQSLETYLQSDFDPIDSTQTELPVADEFHVGWWRRLEARDGGDARTLVAALPQFLVPIEEGASSSERYQALVRRGEPAAELDGTPASGDGIFVDPDSVRWTVVDHPAGGLPVVTLGHRTDFERAFRAIGGRCEPIPVGPNVHALYVSGLPNPVRMREIEASFLESGGTPADWPAEIRRRRADDATSFHDRIILLHPAPYGGIAADRVGGGLDDAGWVEASMRLRLEHEFTHHATHRLLGSYRLHVHDEVLADLMGFVAGIGRFEAGLFLEGLGVPEGSDEIPEDARLRTYVRELDPAAWPSLVRGLRSVAAAVERRSEAFTAASGVERLRLLLSLSGRDLGALAREGADAELPLAFREPSEKS